jgi:hypothetical protein
MTSSHEEHPRGIIPTGASCSSNTGLVVARRQDPDAARTAHVEAVHSARRVIRLRHEQSKGATDGPADEPYRRGPPADQYGRGARHGRFAWRHHRRDLRLLPLGSGSGKHVIPTTQSRSSGATGTSRRWEALARLSSGRAPLMGSPSGIDRILVFLAWLCPPAPHWSGLIRGRRQVRKAQTLRGLPARHRLGKPHSCSYAHATRSAEATQTSPPRRRRASLKQFTTCSLCMESGTFLATSAPRLCASMCASSLKEPSFTSEVDR